ncbi:hypothetical protein RQM65_17660 [Pricia sp. S334]|uniref:DUF2029 domain-containing protein n=1 Tax=Pricia mediterranea TaxID=3076079 RepID=A0ABU3L9S6_9FLAO|nr:hypothetical protein [Pricia sp. S334]MDT7830500.1 hypothetical protein [Pricia sp. S334]
MTTKLPGSKAQRKALPYLVALGFTLVIFGLHMLPNMDSMLNENNTRISHGFLKSQIDYHQEIAPFARRPLTSLLIENLTESFGLRDGHSFILVNFFLLFCSGILLFKLSRKLKSTPTRALANMSVYFLSFSVLFAFFPPVFSYDEPMQYCFILLALIAFVQAKWSWYVPLFTLALISRETSLLLLPALVLFFPGMKKVQVRMFSKAHLRLCVPVLLPLLFYGIYLAAFIAVNEQLQATQIEMASRYTCFLENFESTKNSVETWTSLYLALAPFLYLVAVKLKGNGLQVRHKKWIRAFLLTVAINAPIVILTAFARETRLFALPLFFIWPVFASLFASQIIPLFSVRLYSKVGRKWSYSLTFLILNAANYGFCFVIYPNLGLGQNTFFGEYLFLINLLMTLHGTLSLFIRRNPTIQKIA